MPTVDSAYLDKTHSGEHRVALCCRIVVHSKSFLFFDFELPPFSSVTPKQLELETSAIDRSIRLEKTELLVCSRRSYNKR